MDTKDQLFMKGGNGTSNQTGGMTQERCNFMASWYLEAEKHLVNDSGIYGGAASNAAPYWPRLQQYQPQHQQHTPQVHPHLTVFGVGTPTVHGQPQQSIRVMPTLASWGGGMVDSLQHQQYRTMCNELPRPQIMEALGTSSRMLGQQLVHPDRQPYLEIFTPNMMASTIAGNAVYTQVMSSLGGANSMRQFSPAPASPLRFPPVYRNAALYAQSDAMGNTKRADHSYTSLGRVASQEVPRPRKRPIHKEELAFPVEEALQDDAAAYKQNKMIESAVTGPYNDVGLGGQYRLQIIFLSLGTLPSTDVPLQTFGKCRLLIPSGLSGAHRMYGQPWEFEIQYNIGSEKSLPRLSAEPGTGVCCLTWRITNTITNHVTEMTETIQQARRRQESGRTISNLVMQHAMEDRASELEATLRRLDPNGRIYKTANGPDTPLLNPLRQVNLRKKIRRLRPKRFGEGLLFFGLRHNVVQQHHSGTKISNRKAVSEVKYYHRKSITKATKRRPSFLLRRSRSLTGVQGMVE
jgi:hypothetical protein